MCFIERETRNFILKFREILSWRETVPGLTEWNLMKSRLLSTLCIFFFFFLKNKMVHVVIDKYFFFASEKFWRFFLTQGYHSPFKDGDTLAIW